MTAGENPTSDDWAGARGEKWLAQLDRMEAMLAPVDAPLIAALAPAGARRLADLACGGGGTTLALAAATDLGAAVFGYDISPVLVAFATKRAQAHVPRPIFAVGDSASLAVDAPFDRIVSRFGTMFFADPAAAFANIATLLAPGGRFAFAVWGPPADNGWMGMIRDVVAELIKLPPPLPDAPGPMRYGDVDRLLGLLDAAGFRDLAVTDWQHTLGIGGNLAPAEAARFAIESMSVAQALAAEGSAMVAAATALLEQRFALHWSDGAVRLPARVHLVHGTR